MSLTNRQRVFVEEYLRTWNATAAAIAAGYSEKTSYSIGSENLTKPEIDAEIKRRLSELVMSTDEALTRLAEQGRGAHAAYIDEYGIVDLAGMKAAGKMHLIKGVKPTAAGLVVEFHDAQAAIDKILRVHGAYVERRELSGKDGGPVATEIVIRYASDSANDSANANDD